MCVYNICMNLKEVKGRHESVKIVKIRPQML